METPRQSPGEAFGGFGKRTHSVQSFLAGSSWFVRALPRLGRATVGDGVDPRFREKLLLTVTAANECRYCVRAHTSLADAAGVDDETVARLLESDVDGAVPPAERPALLFALRYAETDGAPDRELLAALEDAHEPAVVTDIVALVRAMHFLNLLGNSVDVGLYAVERRIRRGLRRARASCPV